MIAIGNTPRVLQRIKALSSMTERGIRRAFYVSGKRLVKTASDDILKAKTGRAYKYKGRTIRAGISGGAWANRSGRARRGLDFSVRGSTQMTFYNKTPWVVFLERGTSKMKPRPAMKNSLIKNERNILLEFRKQIRFK